MLTRRRLMAVLGAALPPLGAAGAARAVQPVSGPAYYRGPPSDHFDGERFFNPGGQAPRSLGEFLRSRLTGRPEPWPAAVPSPFPPDRPPPRVTDGMRVAMVGHATLLIQTDGLNVLTDPVWSERASPSAAVGPRRRNPPGIPFDDLPPIDAVLVSHNHYDHLDTATLGRLWQRFRPVIVTPLGNDAIIRAERVGIPVRALDWKQATPLGDRARVTVEPAHHWSARGLDDRNRALWGSFVLEAGGRRVFFAGDTGFGEGRTFREVAGRHPAIDLALLPIGAYRPRRFMAPNHMDPDDAVRALGILGAAHALGYHWNTFRLTDEGPEDPARDLAAALSRRGVAPERFVAMRPGQVWRDEA